MAGMRHDDNRAWAEAHVATIPMIETAEAIENLDEILSVPGVDAIYVGPADLSISLGLGPYGNDGNAVFEQRCRRSSPPAKRHGVVPGVHASGPLTPVRREQGFRMITVTSDQLVALATPASLRGPARMLGDGFQLY